MNSKQYKKELIKEMTENVVTMIKSFVSSIGYRLQAVFRKR